MFVVFYRFVKLVKLRHRHPGKIECGALSELLTRLGNGGQMDVVSGIFEGISTFQWETFFQLVSVALIMLAGPIIIFILAARGGNM